MRNRGFTLIELLVVIAIISLLSSVVMTNINIARMESRNLQRIQNVNSIANGFYIATTGTTNQFPMTTDTNPPYKCLGKTSCWNSTYVGSSTIDNLLKSGMAGATIPTDPFWKTGQEGDAYVYGGFTSSKAIYWVMEGDGNTDKPCGRGLGGWVTVNNDTGYLCMLYLDKTF